MSEFTRYAVYYLPESEAYVPKATAWLGWDVALGGAVERPALEGLPRSAAELTAKPAKYGLHGTLKPPFRLADGTTVEDLKSAVRSLATGLAPAHADGLKLARIGRFMALVPDGAAPEIGDVASLLVAGLDRFRAPAPEAELQRRRGSGLTDAEEANLQKWGYPYVMDCFRFHITLTGPLEPGEADAVQPALAEWLGPLPRPFTMDGVALVGEAEDGSFHLVQRYALTGRRAA